MTEVGDVISVSIRTVAHGGAMIAATDTGSVTAPSTVFVRHALPGESGRAVVTGLRKSGRLIYADLIEVDAASPDRIEPQCRFSGPGACGGCDFQHVALPAQRKLKAAVVQDAMRRTGGFAPGDLPWDGQVHPVPGDESGLRWRTRSRFDVQDRGLAMHRWHSRDLIAIDDCLIATTDLVRVAREAAAGAGSGLTEIAAVATSAGDVLAGPVRQLSRTNVREGLGARVLQVGATGFWQVHPGAAEALSREVSQVLQPLSGAVLLDLYAGVGLFTAALSPGDLGAVYVVEGDAAAAAGAQRNLRDLPQCRVVKADVSHWLAGYRGRVDAVVLDPPRTGAGRQVLGDLDRLRPARVAYVACDPVALARDLRTCVDLGWRVVSLRAFDLFPMTHHIECVAGLAPPR